MTVSPPEWVFKRAQELAWMGTSHVDVARDLQILGATPLDVAYVLVAPAPLGFGLDKIPGDVLRSAGFTRDEIAAAVSATPPRFVKVRWDGHDEATWVPAPWVDTLPDGQAP